MRCKSDFWPLLLSGMRTRYTTSGMSFIYSTVYKGILHVASGEGLGDLLGSPKFDFDQTSDSLTPVHTEAGFDQFNYGPGAAREIQFLSVTLETDRIG